MMKMICNVCRMAIMHYALCIVNYALLMYG